MPQKWYRRIEAYNVIMALELVMLICVWVTLMVMFTKAVYLNGGMFPAVLTVVMMAAVPIYFAVDEYRMRGWPDY